MPILKADRDVELSTNTAYIVERKDKEGKWVQETIPLSKERAERHVARDKVKAPRVELRIVPYSATPVASR